MKASTRSALQVISIASLLQVSVGFWIATNPTKRALGHHTNRKYEDTSLSTFDRKSTRVSLLFTPDRPGGDNSNNNEDNTGTDHRGGKNKKYNRLEFKDLEPLPENDKRRERIERELEIRAQFAEFGDSLWELRSEMDTLSTQLLTAIEGGHDDLEELTREKLRQVESRDPELVYMLAVSDYERAKLEGRTEDAEKFHQRAKLTRSCLPQFNLDGLWVGKYGNRYQLINITYVGDTLIAEKVTGDDNVPKGEITFQVDFNPLKIKKSSSSKSSTSMLDKLDSSIRALMRDVLQPIQLTDKAAKKWGTKKLPRYAGLGQVAEHGFKNHQWLQGQLILIGDSYFSFAWIPIEQQIFFGRPSPELAIKMIKEAGTITVPSTIAATSTPFLVPPALNANIATLKEFAMRCLDKTHEVEDDIDTDGLEGGCIWRDSDDQCHFE